MFYTIENEYLKATFSSIGAEMQSLICKANQKEYIWYAKEEIWGEHAPMLFPVIARLKDGEYSYKGEIYQIPMHGFAKHSALEVLTKTDTSITFVLKATQETLKMYPFQFELQVCFTLEGNTLKKEHTIINHDEKDMYYELGGHDGYNICLADGETTEDYYIDFGTLDALEASCTDENILFTKDIKKIPLTNGVLPLSMETFKDDAIVCRKIPVHTVSLKSKKSDYCVKFEFEGFDTLGIWTRYLPYDSKYICLEPWTTLPDCAYLGKEIEEKVDIRILPAGKRETLSFCVTIQ